MRPDTDPPKNESATQRGFTPYFMVLALGSMWGLTFTLARLATDAGVTPLGYAFWQSAGAGTVVLAICLVRRSLPPFSLKHILYYAMAGIIGIALPSVISTFSVIKLNAGLIAVTVNTTPLLTYALAISIGLERGHPRRLIGLLVGFAGVLVLLSPGASLPDLGSVGWMALAFTVPLCFAIANVLSAKYRPDGVDSMALAGGMLVVSACGLAIPTFLTGSFHPLFFGGSAETTALGLARADTAILIQIMVSSAAYILFFEILRRAGVLFFSQTGYIVTLAGLFWGMTILGESHSPFTWVAVALIFCGLALVNMADASAERRSK